jgi:putative tryptophan/tyrosine transport system substrate-binding protein
LRKLVFVQRGSAEAAHCNFTGLPMRRRDFIELLGGAAAAWPLTARAQQRGLPVIGLAGVDENDRFRVAIRRGLAETGYVDGQNAIIDYRWTSGDNDRFPVLIGDFVRRRVSVIVVITTAGALAAKAVSSTIPIVFGIGSDPVVFGLVASLNRPGGNVTGVTMLTNELTAKRLEMLHLLLPTVGVVALLVNPTNPNAESDIRIAQAAADVLGLKVVVVNAKQKSDFEAAFAMSRERAGALQVTSDAFFDSQRGLLIALADQYRLPTIFEYGETADAGGLMSYGPSLLDSWRLMGNYAGRILEGEKPADLPVDRATKIELVINLKTAKTLGVTFPLILLGRADRVIE